MDHDVYEIERIFCRNVLLVSRLVFSLVEIDHHSVSPFHILVLDSHNPSQVQIVESYRWLHCYLPDLLFVLVRPLHEIVQLLHLSHIVDLEALILFEFGVVALYQLR